MVVLSLTALCCGLRVVGIGGGSFGAVALAGSTTGDRVVLPAVVAGLPGTGGGVVVLALLARFAVCNLRSASAGLLAAPATVVLGSVVFDAGGLTEDGCARLRSFVFFLLSLLSGGFAMVFPVTACSSKQNG